MATDIQELEEQAADLEARIQAIEEMARATPQSYREDSVVNLHTLSGAGLVAFLGNLSEQKLTEIVQAVAAVRERRQHAPRQVIRGHDKKEDEEDLTATKPARPRAGTGIYIEGEGVVRAPRYGGATP